MKNQNKATAKQPPPDNLANPASRADAWARNGRALSMPRVLVTGAGGFIGGHLCKRLKALSYWVRGVDIKQPEFEPSPADEWLDADLRLRGNAQEATRGVDWVFALAADMGGMGYIGEHHFDILTNNLLINANTLQAAAEAGVYRYFFSSSACVYPESLQLSTGECALEERDAYPANPDTAYGWEKLITEIACEHAPLPLQTRVARFHNCYGPLGTWGGGREKAPAALCRKVATAKLGGTPAIDVWGDGKQTRSFIYIDDLIDGMLWLMESGYSQPLNIGSDRMVSINELAHMVMKAAGVTLDIEHVEGTQGVRGRNSNNRLCREVLGGWEPHTSLEDGIARTYQWVEAQVKETL